MANRAVFKSATKGVAVKPADTVNAAGGIAYSFGPEHQLAQLASTGTFNDTFYQGGSDQLAALKHAADQCSPEFIAKCAIYSREKAFMKDMPAALAVILSKADPKLLDKVFDRVIDNGKQLRNFVQFIRSGQFGRKSLGSGPKRLIQRWFANKSDYALFRASIGDKPSLGDIIKLARPKPLTPARQAFYAREIGKAYSVDDLPESVRIYEKFKSGDRSVGLPKVDFRLLTSLPLTEADWAEIARNGGWHQTRMNLNTYARHGVFESEDLIKLLADQIRNREDIKKARVFPYQLLAAYLNTGDVPERIRLALQDAVDVATENVPVFEGNVVVVVDVSGSMSSSVTGYRKGATSKMRCVDVASLIAACVMRKNPSTMLVPVDTEVRSAKSINPRDSIVTNADKLSRFGGGGTRLGAALQYIIKKGKSKPDLVIMVSDNESWYSPVLRDICRGTEFAECWSQIRQSNPSAKMVCIDLLANTTTQVVDGAGVMNIGGFNDSMFETISRFVNNTKLADSGPANWVAEINAIDLSTTDVKADSGEVDETGVG